MDLKNSLTVVVGVIVVAIIVVAIAAVAFDIINGSLSTEPSPGPSPGPSGSSVTPAPTPTSTPGVSINGPIYLGAVLNRTSGMCLVTIMLNKDTPSLDVSKLTMNIECDGQTYRNVWSPGIYDWAGADSDRVLEFSEVLSPLIDTAASGIPQDRPLTIIILQDSVELQQVSVTPT